MYAEADACAGMGALYEYVASERDAGQSMEYMLQNIPPVAARSPVTTEVYFTAVRGVYSNFRGLPSGAMGRFAEGICQAIQNRK
jgi:hypothetical protein